jgi:hypothetical protein
MQLFRKFAVTIVAMSAMAFFTPSSAAAEACEDGYAACLANAIVSSTSVVELGPMAVECTYVYVDCLRHAMMAA